MQTTEPHAGNPSQANGVDIDSSPLASKPLLPTGEVALPNLCRDINEKISLFLAEDAPTERLRNLQEQTKVALGVIREALDRYSLSEISLSYNGGKDCLVLLVLYLCALHNHPALTATEPIQSVYIVSKHPFQEVEDFVASSSKTSSLALARYAKGMKDAFTDYLIDHPSVKAIFVGTRRTDPHGAALTHFDRTDHGWPDFMRIHPVIDWHYVDIWTFIRHLNIPYCPLYDMGYTSLGGTTDTHRNPALRRSSHSSSGTPRFEFRPAYELIEDDEERLGRDWERRGAPATGIVTPQPDRPHEVKQIGSESAIADDNALDKSGSI